jgi:2-oxoglutarate dehydrogenase E2 component (dihydrolipoamide succinyltransferase)
MRRAIADHMTRAYRAIPHGQTVLAADLSRLVAWRDANKLAFVEAEGANLTLTVCFVSALASALAGHAQRSVDVGVAVAVAGGVIVPVLRAADTLGLGATARAVADLASRARTGKLAADDTRGAMMTLTNVGSFGNLIASPIIPDGQLGIVAPGLVERRPLPARDGGVRPGWQCFLSLTFDRRALDDFAADRFLRSVLAALSALPDLA